MFIKGLPIWIKDKEDDMNIQAKFLASFTSADDAVLKITGATYYKVFLNGNLIQYGPSPTAKGYARVDVINLNVIPNDKNTIVIEAAGYNCFSYAAVKQTSYIQAEVMCGDQCVAATGFDFIGYHVPARIQKTMRYSFQRHFTEIWDFARKDREEKISILKLDLKYLERRAPLPDMEKEEIRCTYASDKFSYTDSNWELPSLQGAIDKISDIIDGFRLDKIEEKPAKDFSNFQYNISKNTNLLPCSLSQSEYAVFECRNNTCGLINLKYRASDDCKIIIAFDEKLIDGRFDYKNWQSINVIEITSAGTKEFTNFDIYGFKYFAIFVVEGSMEIEAANVIKVRTPIKNPPELKCNDETILKIYDAACESARCNTLGIFMDCPSRERGGYLCDSYYTAQSAYILTGNTDIEDDFIENFVNADCKELPKGMLPMCYPSDHTNGNYIPQWAMWFIIQVNQYIERNKNTSVYDYKSLSYNLLEYFKQYENEFGLLENLDGWNFIEWSEARHWTAGINFPTNMLYCRILGIIGSWFGDETLLHKSQDLKKTIINMSFDGKFFRDQALRNGDNVPVCQEHISEVCQYYAFRFEIADTENFEDLYKTLVTDFIPSSNNWKNIEKVNAFIGMYMRMELLMEWGYRKQLVEEIKAFFGHMADITGTLWEHKNMVCSLNHGFTAYLVVLLLKIYNEK